MYAVNITSASARFEIAGGPGEATEKHELGPGEFVKLADGYCVRHRAPSGLQPSVVEKLTNGAVVPESDERAAEILRASRRAKKA